MSNNFNSEEYLEVISEVLPNFFQNSEFIWMHDNEPIHKTQEIRDFFDFYEIPKMMWPARSPDLNPIENLWGQITRKLDLLVDIQGEATSANQLWQRVQACANQINQSTFKNLYNSMLKRIRLVIEKDGYYTK